jgi:hypothetical protein
MIEPTKAKRKSQCFSSSWWVIEREPDVTAEDEDGETILVAPGRATRYALLSAPEMAKLGAFGRVYLRDLDRTLSIG